MCIKLSAAIALSLLATVANADSIHAGIIGKSFRSNPTQMYCDSAVLIEYALAAHFGRKEKPLPRCRKFLDGEMVRVLEVVGNYHNRLDETDILRVTVSGYGIQYIATAWIPVASEDI